ncbi:hypothetical protein AB1I63_04540 [Streptococcus pneumoniae]
MFVGFNLKNRLSTQVWGFFPSSAWIEKSLSLLDFHRGKLALSEEFSIESGDSHRLDTSGWVREFDPDLAWLRFGNPHDEDLRHVEFYHHCIAGISFHGTIRALWLKVNHIL